MEMNLKLALLIDGDNAQASLLPQMLAELSKYGTTTIRRVYGDWSQPNMKSWKEVLDIYGLHAEQQFAYTKGKNATDIALVIDAMDFLHKAVIDGVCIVASDSDYTPLATRLGENLFVIGIGKKLTPLAFVKACAVFIYIEDLKPVEDALPPPVIAPSPKKATPQKASAQAATPVKKATPQKASADTKKPDVVVAPSPKKATAKKASLAAVPVELKRLFTTAFDSAVQEDGWAHLGTMGGFLYKLDPAFDPRTYGHKQLSQLVQAYPSFFEVNNKKAKGGPSDIYIRLKK